MKNVRRIITSSKSDKAGPGTSRPLAKRSGGSMEGAGKNAPAMGASGKHATRTGSGSALAHPIPGAKTPSKKLKSAHPTAANFEAPITITIQGRTAAVIRFSAHLNDRSPEEEAMAAISADALNDLENGFGHTHDSATKWLAEDNNSPAAA